MQNSKKKLENKLKTSYEEQIKFINEFFKILKTENNINYFKEISNDLIYFINLFKIPFAILFLKKEFYEFSIQCFFENNENMKKIISLIIETFNFEILIDKKPTSDFIKCLNDLNIPYDKKKIREKLTKEEELFKNLIMLEYDINELR